MRKALSDGTEDDLTVSQAVAVQDESVPSSSSKRLRRCVGANSASDSSPGMTRKKAAGLVEKADLCVSAQLNQKRKSWPMRLMGGASEIGDQPQMRMLCAATIAFGVVRRDSRLAKTGFTMLAAHTLATWGKDGVKAIVDRTRPDSGDNPKVRLGNSDAHDETSFPSGHSAGAVAVAEAYVRSYPDHAVAARAAALAVAAVQVPRGTHYAGDVVAGALIGLVGERASGGMLSRVMAMNGRASLEIRTRP